MTLGITDAVILLTCIVVWVSQQTTIAIQNDQGE